MVDWKFIEELEGGMQLNAYVPNPETSKSGVTVACGVDLGQLSINGLRNAGVNPKLVSRLVPYLGKRKWAAVALLDKSPLTLAPAEARELCQKVRSVILDDLKRYYKQDAHRDWELLADEQQTVIASVAFQYGPRLYSRTPRFWNCICNGYWATALRELRNFGDAYPTRRNKEANYLESALNQKGIL